MTSSRLGSYARRDMRSLPGLEMDCRLRLSGLGPLRFCLRSPSPLYSGERGWGEGCIFGAAEPLTPNPSPLSTGERGAYQTVSKPLAAEDWRSYYFPSFERTNQRTPWPVSASSRKYTSPFSSSPNDNIGNPRAFMVRLATTRFFSA